jgi:hypothetical protein
MKRKYDKKTLDREINVEKISYEQLGRNYNVSGVYIKKLARKFGIALPVRKKFPDNFIPANKGNKKVKSCVNCKKEIEYYGKKYCSNECKFAHFPFKTYNSFLENNDKYCRASYTPRIFKKFFLLEQNYRCSICKMPNVWNKKVIIFVLDHIDGDASNNKRDNLRLVCPNCDSQLDTFKSKNKNSARKNRYLERNKKRLVI